MIGVAPAVRPLLALSQRISPPVAVLALAGLVLFTRLDDRDLWAAHEARAGQNAQFILRDRSIGVSQLIDGTPEQQKPPLYYWLVAGVGLVRGQVDAVAIRLPAAIAGWLTIHLVMAFLRRRGRPTAAWVAGLVLISTHHFVAISRTGRIDVPLACAITGAILCGLEQRMAWAGLCVAAGLMLKGPIAVVVPVAVWCACGLPIRDQIKASRTAMAGVPWFLFAGWDFCASFFWYHNVQRAAGTAAELTQHPWWFYLVRLAANAAPWSWLLVMARWDAVERVAWKWLLVVVALLSVSSFKRADYLIPAYPAIAILIGCAVERRQWGRAALAIGAVALATCLTWQVVVLPRQDARSELRSTAALIREHVAPRTQIIFFRVEDHLLAFHLGWPIATVREWENLDIWVARSQPGWIVMNEADAALWPSQIKSGRLVEVARLPDRSDRDKPRHRVLMKSTHDAASTAGR